MKDSFVHTLALRDRRGLGSSACLRVVASIMSSLFQGTKIRSLIEPQSLRGIFLEAVRAGDRERTADGNCMRFAWLAGP